MKSFPMLYHKGKGGAIFSWRIWTEGNSVFTEHGQIDGKKQIAEKQTEAKNVGRSNATTAEEQAEAEAASMHTFKLDRKYSLTIEGAKEPLSLPMLAHKYEDHLKKVTFPCHVQPKLDGFRCIARWDGDEVLMFSRSGKEFSLPHIAAELAKTMPREMELDGELYLSGVSFQSLSSWIKKNRSESEQIEYHVYDMPADAKGDPTHPWGQRHKNLVEWFNKNRSLDKVKQVETSEAKLTEDISEITLNHVANGMEGGIVRLLSGAYQYGYRSHDLLKVKQFQDEEFEIVGANSGSGKFKDCCIWECVTKEGRKFSVVPKGTLEYKRELLNEADEHVGEMLKVEFFGKTQDGIPRFPVGIAILDAFILSLER